MSHETLLILNPASAGGATGRRARALCARIEARLGPLRVARTSGPRDAERLAREACRQGVSRLIVGGGDGTTSEVVSGLLGASRENRVGQALESGGDAKLPILGLLPLGSGWDLARALGLPRDLDAALSVIDASHTRTIDAGQIEYQDASGALRHGYFVNEASAGLSGATVRLVGNTSKRFGSKLGFLIGAVGAIFSHRPLDMAVEVDGERVYEGSVSMVVAANGSYFGAGMHVAPRAIVDDGLLEVLLVRGLSIPRLLVNLPSLYFGRHLGHPKVSRYAARLLTLIPKQAGAPLDVDGESLGSLPFCAEVLPGALQVFCPAAAIAAPPPIAKSNAR